MNFESFSTLPIEGYVDFFRRNPGFWLFHHVPKTAGSSLLHEMSGLLRPYCNIHAPFDDPNSDRRELLRQAVDTFVETHARSPYRSASGHLRPPHVRTILKAVPDCRVFTVLREPVARLVSEYRYMCTPKHPTYKEHLEKYPRLEDFVADKRNTNRITKLLCPQKEIEQGRAAAHVRERYCFVGFVEDYPLTFQFLTLLMIQLPVVPTVRANETILPPGGHAPLGEELRAYIADLNQEDCALYTELHGIYRRRRPEMERLIEQHRR